MVSMAERSGQIVCCLAFVSTMWYLCVAQQITHVPDGVIVNTGEDARQQSAEVKLYVSSPMVRTL